MLLGQVKTGEKRNEITAIPELLDSLDVNGDTISIDAMGCRTDIAAKIREQEADYYPDTIVNTGFPVRRSYAGYEYLRKG
jgi:predicted transposase YbfD/YdcC